ncbi:unnamed protein product [Diamesa serratosioi]
MTTKITQLSPRVRVKKEISHDVIKEFAETAMNELLGWYGYENGNTNLKQSSNNLKAKEKQNENETRDSTSWISRESSRSPILSIVGQKENDCSWCHRSIQSQSNEILGTTEGTVFCSESCFSQSRRASFKRAKSCDWCKNIRSAVSYVDFLDGANQLQFCSDKCLNQYKMQIFCRETQAHLDLPHLAHLREKTNSTDNLITPDLWMNNCHSRSPSSSESSQEPINNLQTFVPRTTTATNLQLSSQLSKNKLKRTSDAINESDVEQISSSLLTSAAITTTPSTTCHKNINKKRRLPLTRTSGGFVNNRQYTTELRAKPIAQLTNSNLQSAPSTQTQNTQYQQQPHQQQQHQQQQPSFKSTFPPNFFHLRPPLQTPHFNGQGPEDIRMNPNMMNPLAPITLVPYPIPIILPMVIPIPIPMNAIDFLKAYHLKDYKMKDTKTKEEEMTTTTSTATTTTATTTTTTATVVDNNNYNEPIDYTKSKSNDTLLMTQEQWNNEQKTSIITSANTTTSCTDSVERKLPKFKITRLNSKRHFTKDFIESCRPLRKRKPIMDDDDVDDNNDDDDDKDLSS